MKRRSFLQLLGATVASTALPSILEAVPTGAPYAITNSLTLDVPKSLIGQKSFLSFWYKHPEGEWQHHTEEVIPQDTTIKIGLPAGGKTISIDMVQLQYPEPKEPYAVTAQATSPKGSYYGNHNLLLNSGKYRR